MERKFNKIILFVICVIIVVLLSVILGKKEDKWIQEGNTITKGNQTLNIGDIYDYDETNGGKLKDLTDVNWRVLGVDEDGNLLIMSTMNVADVTLGEKDNLELSQNDYVDGINKLNELADSYGLGKGAISARSITADDVNKIMNYDYNKYTSGIADDYNNELTYYWVDSSNPMYKGINGVTGNLSNKHEKFVWYDEQERKWNTSLKQDATLDNPIEITTLKSNFYAYSNISLDPSNADNMERILDTDTNQYKMLFEDEKGERSNYWLATQFLRTAHQFAGYGYFAVKGEEANYNYLVYSMGASRGYTLGLRVVVTIE